MSSYACVYLSDGRPICWFRNGVDQLFFILFTRDDWIELSGPDAMQLVKRNYSDLDENDARVTGFRVRAGVLRERLDVLGVPLSAVVSELERLAAESVDRIVRLRPARGVSPELDTKCDQELQYLTGLTWERWLEDLTAAVRAGQPVARWGLREPIGSASWLMTLWDDHDPRFQLRAVLEAVPPEEEIVLDLDDLLEGGWLDPSVDPREHANDLVAYTTHGGLPPIVLTEGRFDVEVLSAAMRLRRPRLVGYIRFPDFAQKNEGGASALRQTIRAFASAGIPNRVVAIFDNDTAARDAVEAMDVETLPTNLVISRLPDIELAKSYPTVGPQGEHAMDVNGLAASIEMYLGTDVLADNGVLLPVIWGGYFKRLGAYQGEISDKDTIQERFRRKVADALANPDLLTSQDWTGLDLVLDHIVELLRETTTID